MSATSVHPSGLDLEYRRPRLPADDLEAILRGLTVALVLVAIGSLVFTATNVTGFALAHGVPRGIAWMLDPLVAGALGVVLVVDGRLAEHDIKPGGAASFLRWFAGLATWLMNCWSSLWPTGTPWGVPRHLDPAGLLLHSVLPVLLIALAEGITRYRRRIVARLRYLERVSTDGDTAGGAPVHRAPAPEPVPAPVRVPGPVPAPAPAPAPVPAAPAPRRLLTICGPSVYAPAVPPAARLGDRQEAPEEPQERLSPEEAQAVIEAGFAAGRSIRDTARAATRSPSFVGRVYQELRDGDEGPRQ
ncbi:helix-turn-helix domain-containing protein, partial [Streptomyces sp. NPDC045456]|uniref:helix-turn-helix domain-containing protein n=1 Tax=Streptomyces sp. NPDC045456 TaxID=3155254 RepID=UPI0033CE7FC7